MRVYHRTPHGEAILRDGFRDGEGTYLTTSTYRGVWVSNVPLDGNEGAEGDDLLGLDLPPELFEQYEWVEDGKAYREALLPAEILNRYPRERVSEAEEDTAWAMKFPQLAALRDGRPARPIPQPGGSRVDGP